MERDTQRFGAPTESTITPVFGVLNAAGDSLLIAVGLGRMAQPDEMAEVASSIRRIGRMNGLLSNRLPASGFVPK
jgi:hypothetical protein